MTLTVCRLKAIQGDEMGNRLVHFLGRERLGEEIAWDNHDTREVQGGSHIELYPGLRAAIDDGSATHTDSEGVALCKRQSQILHGYCVMLRDEVNRRFNHFGCRDIPQALGV